MQEERATKDKKSGGCVSCATCGPKLHKSPDIQTGDSARDRWLARKRSEAAQGSERPGQGRQFQRRYPLKPKSALKPETDPIRPTSANTIENPVEGSHSSKEGSERSGSAEYPATNLEPESEEPEGDEPMGRGYFDVERT